MTPATAARYALSGYLAAVALTLGAVSRIIWKAAERGARL